MLCFSFSIAPARDSVFRKRVIRFSTQNRRKFRNSKHAIGTTELPCSGPTVVFTGLLSMWTLPCWDVRCNFASVRSVRYPPLLGVCCDGGAVFGINYHWPPTSPSRPYSVNTYHSCVYQIRCCCEFFALTITFCVGALAKLRASIIHTWRP